VDRTDGDSAKEKLLDLRFLQLTGENKMRKLALSLLFLLAASFAATAQTTTLTNSGGSTPGCLTVTKVNDQSASGDVCFGGFYGEDPYGIDIDYGQVTIEDCTITSQLTQQTSTGYQVTSNFTCPASANTLQRNLSGTSIQQEQKVPRSCGRNRCYALVVTSGTTTF
jgi:hypothetical protein